MIRLSDIATEQSTFVITAVFTDEDGTAVTPKTIVWTLTDRSTGAVINSRDQVSVAAPASSINIVLSGDDLQILSGESGKPGRVIIIEATYDSTLGTDLPIKEAAYFLVQDIDYVT